MTIRCCREPVPEAATRILHLPRTGPLAITAAAAGLRSIDFSADIRRRVSARAEADERIRHHLDTAERELRRYDAGEAVRFTVPVDLDGLPPFTRLVLEILSQVPFGRTVSYGELAALAGRPRGARAVGQAMSRNPVPVVIPCHRVLAGGGRLGGFSGGLGTKRRLLAIEGIDLAGR